MIDKIWPIKPSHLFALSIIFAIFAVYGLRANNLNMVEYRDKVYEADATGKGVTNALENLRNYIFDHMNTSTEVELVSSYNREIQKSINKAQGSNTNVDIFADLPASCNTGGFVDTTTPCVRDHINRKLSQLNSSNPSLTRYPEKQLYIYGFKAPLLSFDLAGILLIISGLCGLAGIGLILKEFIKDELAFYKGDIEGL